MTNIPRQYSPLEPYLEPNKVLVIYGARQIGKTTLVTQYLQNTPHRYKIDSGDDVTLQHFLADASFDDIKSYVADYELIVIDEAQRIPHIGQCLKIMVDQHPGLRIIVTGSSSFELAGQVGEPLTGRKTTLTLYAISQLELMSMHDDYQLKNQLESYMIYGCYPEIITADTAAKKKQYVTEIANAYLLKDILAFDKIRNPKALLDLLRLLAFQIGSEVSLSELGQKIMLDIKSVKRYIDLLEKTFVIYHLPGFSRNLRNEITKKNKYYFYDCGIRNALIANFNGLSMRNDVGALWENFIITERLKSNAYQNRSANSYFWRTWDKAEIDLIEEREGALFAYEFKWKDQKYRLSKVWSDAYPDAKFSLVSQKNYLTFLKESDRLDDK